MKFRFTIDGRAAGPIGDCWETAAHDAVRQGYAVWTNQGIRLSSEGEIERIKEDLLQFGEA